MQKARWLTQTLILSGALNLALLSLFFYFLVRKNPIYLSYKPPDEVNKCTRQKDFPFKVTFFEKLQAIPLDRLLELLNDDRYIEHGFRTRDFALGALVSCHHFDIERGLGKKKISARQWEFEGKVFLLYPGLDDADFQKLTLFVKQEKWPFTLHGLFLRIASCSIPESDLDLIQYFCHTPEFILIETLFARTQIPIQRRTILALVLEGGWESWLHLVQSLRKQADFSPQTRQNYLTQAISNGSSSAAYLLLATDMEYAMQYFNDQQMTNLLKLLHHETKETQEFAQKIVASPRSDEVRQQAFQHLAKTNVSNSLAGPYIEAPEVKDLRPVFRQTPPSAPAPTAHLIQPGESLWSISKKYQVSIELLMKVNHLQSTLIQPGKTLKIP